MTDDRGVSVAAITPRGKHGDVDFGAAFELIDFLGAAGVRGISLSGAAGEYPSLTPEERTRLLYLGVKRSRVPVWAGVGSASLQASVALAREARDAGASGLLLPPPYFFRYEQDEVREFFLQFAELMDGGIEVFLSNLPSFTTEIELETSLELLATGLFTGIEEASGSLESLERLQAAGGPFVLLTGSDSVLRSARCAGAHGAISSAGCAVPELVMALDRAVRAGDQESAARLERMFHEFLDWTDAFPQPAIVKLALGLRGLKTGPLAVPIPPAKQKKADQFRDWFKGWLPAVRKL